MSGRNEFSGGPLYESQCNPQLFLEHRAPIWICQSALLERIIPRARVVFRAVKIVEDFGLRHSKAMFPNKEYALLFSLLAAVELALHTI